MRVPVLIIWQNVSHLSNLRILDIQSNCLQNVSGLSALTNLQTLQISHNALTEISGLEGNINLQILDIANNKITHLTNLKNQKLLEDLWASENEIESFEEVEKELADKKHLKGVYFEKNPLQMNGPALYKNKIRLALPQIECIDGSM